MSGVSIVKVKLWANANVVAVVPTSRIMAGAVPIGSVLPAIGITTVSLFERTTVAMGQTMRMATERVRVNVLAKTYPAQKQLLELVRLALPNVRGPVGNFTCDSIIPDSTGPDFEDTEAVIFSQYRDFVVKYLYAPPV